MSKRALDPKFRKRETGGHHSGRIARRILWAVEDQEASIRRNADPEEDGAPIHEVREESQ